MSDAPPGAPRRRSSVTPSVVQHAATKVLAEAYRVSFPPDLFAFRDFARCLNPDRPLDALDRDRNRSGQMRPTTHL
jgi:hypothetical protein